jgi:phosphoribosyl 1,2-cyclic phosphate phosphodiesterase
LLKITFLGTGTSQGVPVIACACDTCRSIDPRDKRLRSSVLIEAEGKTIIIDTGPDFREQMLRENVKDLDAVLFTHEHKDHTAGLDDIRSFNYIRQKPMDVYAEAMVIRSLKMEFAYIFAEKKYPGVPQVEIHSIENQNFKIDGIEIIPIRVMHYRLPVLGYRIGDFTYITDANYISEEEKEKIIGTRYLVISGLRKQKHISHFSLEEALKLISELSPKRAYITHISHQMGKYENVQKELPAGVMLAYDGLQIEI